MAGNFRGEAGNFFLGVIGSFFGVEGASGRTELDEESGVIVESPLDSSSLIRFEEDSGVAARFLFSGDWLANIASIPSLRWETG